MIDPQSFYLDYVNNFLTIAKIASHYNITEKEAKKLIEEGKKIQNGIES